MSDRSFYTMIAALKLIAAGFFLLAYLNSGKGIYILTILIILLSTAIDVVLAKNSKPNA